MRVLRAMTVGLISGLGVFGASAQDEDVPTGFSIFGWAAPEIVEPYYADRATFAPGAEAVPVGRFSISGGVTYTYNNDDGVEVQNTTLPEVMVRGGIFERVEGRISWDGYSRTEIDSDLLDDSSSGTTDMSVGVKVEVTENRGALPAIGVVAEASLPVGSDDLTSDRVDPSLQIALWWDEVDDFWSFFGSCKVTLLEDFTDDDYMQTAVSAGVGQTWQDGTFTFVEYFGFLNDSDNVEDAHFIQAGAVFEVAPNVSIDARIGAGLSEDSADMFIGAGASLSI